MKYYLTYELIEGKDNEAAAKAFCDRENMTASYYQRKRYPAHYTPYTIENNDGKDTPWHGYICWYYYKR